MMHHRIVNVELMEESNDSAVIIKVKSKIGSPQMEIFKGFDCEYLYKIYPSGEIDINVKGVPINIDCHLPRIGLQMQVPKQFDNVKWFGRGPGESYSDSKEANRFGLYKMKVKDLYTPYIFPQENGNREEVKWVSLTDNKGMGFKAGSGACMNFSAHYFTTEDFDKATHRHELIPRNFITLNLDYKQCGIGSGSCGPETFEKYRIKPEPFEFNMIFSI